MDDGKIMLDKWKADDIITLKNDTNEWEIAFYWNKVEQIKIPVKKCKYYLFIVLYELQY